MAKLTADQYVAATSARLAHLTQTYAITIFASIATMFAPTLVGYGPWSTGKVLFSRPG